MALSIDKAEQYLHEYHYKSRPTSEDDFKYVECLEYLIKETGDSDYMMELGAHYYRNKDFELAEEYYLLAAENKNPYAYECLGYVYYYGRVGQPDYEKAFKYFKLGMEVDDITCSYKLADMYKNGYYVEKNYNEYCKIIKSLYPKVRDLTNLNDPVPEVYTRLASIYKKEGNTKEAIYLLRYAKDFLSQRMMYSDFFGNLTIMKLLIRDLYSMTDIDINDIEWFDLYYVLQYPATIRFSFKSKEYIIDGTNPKDIIFNDTHFENIEDLFQRGTVDNYKFSSLYRRIDYVEVVTWKS